MTGNQRRSGFRLPWLADDSDEDGQPDTPATAPEHARAASADTAASSDSGTVPEGAADEASVTGAAAPGEFPTEATAEPDAEGATNGTPAEPEPSPDFMRELIAAMRRVAEGARDTIIADVRARADARVKLLEADAQQRQEELRTRAEADIKGIGEWARAEAERIKREADQRVTARRGQLEQQLDSDGVRSEAESKAVRDRVNEYERELGAYYAQLAEISDPAAFAAAAKRMPRPPSFEVPHAIGQVAEGPADAGAEPAAATPAATNGTRPPVTDVHPAEEEVLAARLAELDATLPAEDDSAGTASSARVATSRGAPQEPASAESVTTDVVVKGLGSFGAITSFRQVLAGVDGVDGVALSLGQGGEFIFRTTHRPGFDVAAAIVELEGDAARIEPRDQGGLLVTLQRAR